jgi:hypothetical protein
MWRLWRAGQRDLNPRVLDLEHDEIVDAILTLGDAGYIEGELLASTGGDATFTHFHVTGRGLQALGEWPLFDDIVSPLTFAALLDRLAEEAPTEEEKTNARPVRQPALRPHAIRGTHTFHARARYGHECQGRREALWSVTVELGIDPGQTAVDLTNVRDLGDGRRAGTLVVTPRDAYGSPLGPGRGDRFDLTGTPGTTPTGPVRDAGDGRYAVDVAWDSGATDNPGLVLSQPDRPPAVVSPPPRPTRRCPRWLYVLLAVLLALAIVLLVLLLVS